MKEERKAIRPKVEKLADARCQVFSKDFDIQNMGEAAVKTHIKSKKHIDAVEGKLINCFSCLFVHF